MKMTPSWPHANIQPLRRTFCFMLMLHKSYFEKACGNTIWCCSDEITTWQVQEDNLRKCPQMSCVSVVRSSEFELHCPRRSINEGSEIYSDKHQCLCTSCCGEGGQIESSLQQKQSWKVFLLHNCRRRDDTQMILWRNEGTWKPDFSSQLNEKQLYYIN